MAGYKNYHFSPLTIYGLPTSGKGVLAALLDGSKSTDCTLPMIFHDSLSAMLPLYKRYIEDKSTQVAYAVGDDKRSYFLRKLLLTYSNYYISLESALNKHQLNFNFSSSKFIKVNLKCNKDFFELDKKIILDALLANTKEPEILFLVIASNILEALEIQNISSIRYCASVSNNELNNYDSILDSYKEGKIIFVDRPIIDAVGSSFLRESATTAQSFQDVLKRMKSNDTRMWIQKISLSQNYISELSKIFPDRVCIINFEELILNTKNTMKRISDFLDIEFSEIFTKPTFMGSEIAGKEFFTIQDNLNEQISQREINLLKRFINDSMSTTGLNNITKKIIHKLKSLKCQTLP